MNCKLMKQWSESVGGTTAATLQIMMKLGCSSSKAEKIASGRYPSSLVPLEQKALLSLTKFKPSELFPSTQEKSAS
jgi:hypothetical protein